MKHKYLSTLLCMAVASAVNPLWAQVQVNYEKYPDYSPVVKPDPTLGIEKSAVSRTRAKQVRPARVNNAENKFFPPVFNQAGGSCGSASRIGYMFNYEINAYRNLDSKLEENQYPTHFTWLLTFSNSGKEGMAAANGIPTVPVYGGRTYSHIFGNQDAGAPDFGWMQGYDKWYSAMQNRISHNANFPMSVETEEGREAVKNWIWNHNGDTDYHAGGICGIGVASNGLRTDKIPQTTANSRQGVVGQEYITTWGPQVDHALTIVGYDDLIEFDLDKNGKAGEKEKDEVGAWIIVNSWGNGWANGGFVYCPYKNAVPAKDSKGYYMPEVYYVRKNYRPLRTFKIKMDYSKRSELRINGGISSNLNATMPERMVPFEHFKFAGDGDNNGVDADVPMLGRWANGLHYEPMEFGYDLTDLSASFDTRKPLKYFLVIESKSGATGIGKVHACSLIDYEFVKEGFEIPFKISPEGVKIENQGKRTVISVVVPGEPLNAPRNLLLQNGSLQWNEPVTSAYALKGYKVYCDGVKIADLAASQTSFATQKNGNYEVEAIYDVNGTVASSVRLGKPVTDYIGYVPADNKVKNFVNAGFEVVDLMKKSMDQMTIEFWLRPTSVADWNQQIGPGWGRFMFHTTSSGELVVGWDTNNRISSPAGTLKTNMWNHVAIVVDKSSMAAYVNGKKIGNIYSSFSGVGSFGSLRVGENSANGLNGRMDEFRVWNYARTESQIQGYMYAELKDPATVPGLMANIRMDGANGLTDATGHYQVRTVGTQSEMTDNILFRDNRLIQAIIGLPTTKCYVGNIVELTDNSTGGIISWEWNVNGTKEKTFRVANPKVVFTEPGQHTITLKVTDGKGRVRNTTKTLKVEAQPLPVADFRVGSDLVSFGSVVSFINESDGGDGCRYSWSMPGAKVTSANSLNASAVYPKVGTYDVTLTATNASGSHSVTKKVNIIDIAAQAEFSVSPKVVIKGETVHFKDESKHSPSSWLWNIENDAHCIRSYNQNQEVVMKHPGIYSVNLVAQNIMGGDTINQDRAVIVCNADGKSGLNFTSAQQYVELQKDPINDNTAHFTIDWWMDAKSNTGATDFVHQIGNNGSGVLLQTTQKGNLNVTLGGTTYTSPDDFISLAQWHHYAVVFNNGMLQFYKDAVLVAESQTRTNNYKATNVPFRISGPTAPMNAMIDEFRVWNSSLTASKIRQYANNEIADVAGAVRSDALSVYYKFNQNSGDVQDATSNANTGKRVNFGPSGDAWSSSKGIFCLSTLTPEDCTADYLTNYAVPFKYDAKSYVNPTNRQRFLGLLEGKPESGWILENTVITNGGWFKTCFHVDKQKGSAMTLTTSWDNFAGSIADHKAYQYVTLPKGRYRLSVDQQAEFAAEHSNLVVAAGKGLPHTMSMAEDAKAYALLSGKQLNFSIDEEQEDVSLGIVANLQGKNCISLKYFKLERKLLETYGTPTTGMDCEEITDNEPLLKIHVSNGTMEITADEEQHVQIVSVSGVTCFEGDVKGTKRIALAKGIYIVNGQKVMVY